MAFIIYGGTGPGFSLTKSDVEKLNEERFLDFHNEQEDLYGRIRLVSHDPNLMKNGFSLRDSFCESGLRIRRAPWVRSIDSPKPHHYVVRIKEELFEELVTEANKDKARGSCIFPRCRYDRFSINISMI